MEGVGGEGNGQWSPSHSVKAGALPFHPLTFVAYN